MLSALTLIGLTLAPKKSANILIHYFAIYFLHKHSRLLKFVEMLYNMYDKNLF